MECQSDRVDHVDLLASNGQAQGHIVETALQCNSVEFPLLVRLNAIVVSLRLCMVSTEDGNKGLCQACEPTNLSKSFCEINVHRRSLPRKCQAGARDKKL